MEETKNLDNFSENNSESDSEYETERPPTPPRVVLKPIDFEEYVREHYEDKIKLLDRETFPQITKPIIIFFNHFREKCAYHMKLLNTMHELALKYGERIEFIAADIYDIDLLKFKRISLDFFYDESPEKKSAFILAIDEEKRVHELHYADEQSLESLTKLCDDLLNNKLFKSQPLPEPDSSSLVKICVHENYHELVTNSTKNILLIVNHKDYVEFISEGDNDEIFNCQDCSELSEEDCTARCKPNEKCNYEIVAEQLAPYNVDVVYLNGDKNYIPYELGITCYTTLVFIPQDDKNNFILHPTGGSESEEMVINTIKSFIEDHQAIENFKDKQISKHWYHPLKITPDFNLDLKDLPQYLDDKCGDGLKVFEREEFLNIKDESIILIFMDFKNDKCLAHHLKWIDQVYQVSMTLENKRLYLIADFRDIDVINPLWKSQDFIENTMGENMAPKVFGIDQNKNKYQMKEFKNPASLFYFAYSLAEGELEEEDLVSV